jgi:hypothetical protein
METGTGCFAKKPGFVEGGLTGVSGACDYVPISRRANPYGADDWDLNLILSFSVFLRANNFISRRSLS